MSLIRVLLGASALLAACGPQAGDDRNWMLGTFSNSASEGVVVRDLSLSKFTFESDGAGAIVNLDRCGEEHSETPFRWERRDGRAIAIVPDPGEEYVFNTQNEEWRFVPTGKCSPPLGPEGITLDEVQKQEIRKGEVVLDSLVYPGDVCLEQFEPDCPEGNECDDCRTVWCDEPPAPCG